MRGLSGECGGAHEPSSGLLRGAGCGGGGGDVDARGREWGVCTGVWLFFFFQAEDGIRDLTVTGVQTCALPISLAVWEMSPTATLIEHQVVGWLSKLAGYGAGAGGTLTSGGTEANFTAMLAARNAAVPGAWEDGIGGDPPHVVYGEHAHYAVTRAIGQLGMGRRKGIAIPSRHYKIDVQALVETLDRLGHDGK